ncbi:MAG: adenylyltransferase/cytidyltransferase family protein [Acidimicrobiales bacterium]
MAVKGPGEGQRTAATIGTFDGVHVGHQLLVSATRQIADEQGLRDAVITFDRHPFATIRPEATPKLLTTLEEKIELLRSLGVDDVVVLEFDVARSHQEPESFIEDFLVGEIGVAVVVIGAGFRFGHRARGDAAMLQQMGEKLGFSVVTLALVGDETGGIVSSTHIRALIGEARLDDAARLLGRPYEVRGELVRSKTMRVVIPRELLLPPAGTYPIDFIQGKSVFSGVATIPPTYGRDDDVPVVVKVPGGLWVSPGAAALRFRERDDDASLGGEAAR